jgi:hypothetical protein
LGGLRSGFFSSSIKEQELVPSARRAVMPEIKIRRPRASIIIAWEKCPLGSRIFGETISVFGISRPALSDHEKTAACGSD